MSVHGQLGPKPVDAVTVSRSFTAVVRLCKRGRSGHNAIVLDASLALMPEPRAAASARRWASGLLAASVGDDVTGTVELVLTELVQNAVLHANTPMLLRLRAGDGGICVAVADDSPVLPSSGLTHAEAMSGRGLLMVAAVASLWGAEPQPGGKVVWATIRQHASGTNPDIDPEVGVNDLLARWSEGTQTPLQLADRAPLRVPSLPTTTMLAVKTHNDDVFRELTLYAMADDPPEHGPAAEISILAQRARVVLATFADGRQQVRNQVLDAVRAGAATFDLTLAVDDHTLGVLGDYLDVLEQADESASRGLLLSRPPATDVLVVRRRYLRELLAQLSNH